MGLAISKILTFIPQGVGVTARMAGVTCAVFPMPLTVGSCKNCNLGYPLGALLIDYIQRTNLPPNAAIANECPHCKNKSLLVPII
jgi:hypothetical protein